jgi:hypothetical protein
MKRYATDGRYDQAFPTLRSGSLYQAFPGPPGSGVLPCQAALRGRRHAERHVPSHDSAESGHWRRTLRRRRQRRTGDGQESRSTSRSAPTVYRRLELSSRAHATIDQQPFICRPSSETRLCSPPAVTIDNGGYSNCFRKLASSRSRFATCFWSRSSSASSLEILSLSGRASWRGAGAAG